MPALLPGFNTKNDKKHYFSTRKITLKIFPVIGQPFIVLNTIDSTNNYAMQQVNEGSVTPGTTWFAMEQTAGKGQRGKQWLSPPGENLMMTTVLEPRLLALSHQFMLSASIALAAYDCFSKYAGEETGIKWSNDLYWRDRKAGGILIENVLRGGSWQYAIVGIGININQAQFPPHLPNPVSLRHITGKDWDAIVLAKELCACIQQRFDKLMPANFEAILEEYKSHLFRWQQPGLYKQGDQYFEAIIRDVIPDGRLVLEKNGEKMLLGFGEVEFVITK